MIILTLNAKTQSNVIYICNHIVEFSRRRLAELKLLKQFLATLLHCELISGSRLVPSWPEATLASLIESCLEYFIFA